MRPQIRSLALALSLTFATSFLTAGSARGAESRDDMVRNDRAKHAESGLWTYNDLAQGLAQARQTGKPLLVVLRCVP